MPFQTPSPLQRAVFIGTSPRIRKGTFPAAGLGMVRTLEAQQLDAWLRQLRHDLKAPLMTIRGYVDLIQRGAAGPLTPKMQRYLANVMQATLRECALIDSQMKREPTSAESPNPQLPSPCAAPLVASGDPD